MRGIMRSVCLLKPTTPSAGAGAAVQVPTQWLFFGMMRLLPSSFSGLDRAVQRDSTPCFFRARQPATT
jgi:hypothetical protein